MKLVDSSVYLPPGEVTEPWEVCVTGTGHTKMPPGVPYPPGRHPEDHALSWARGRVLRQFQVIYISEGEGRFESPAGRRRVAAGDAVILFPGVWHRYEPQRDTGWVEQWVELTGPAVRRLQRKGVISPQQPLYRLGTRPELLDLFVQCRDLARRLPRGFQPVLALLGLQILARVVGGAGHADPSDVATDEAMQHAQAHIAAFVHLPLRMEEVADVVGMSYSHFRRAFRAQTGVSPKQYHIQLRQRKAQELLTTTSRSVKQIADELGFDSPFHLSADFKARTGCSPMQWRARITGRSAVSTRRGLDDCRLMEGR